MTKQYNKTFLATLAILAAINAAVYYVICQQTKPQPSLPAPTAAERKPTTPYVNVRRIRINGKPYDMVTIGGKHGFQLLEVSQ